MKEYRDRAKNTPGTDTHLLARQSSGAPEKWQTLDQQFGLNDMYKLEADQRIKQSSRNTNHMSQVSCLSWAQI